MVHGPAAMLHGGATIPRALILNLYIWLITKINNTWHADCYGFRVTAIFL
jgi:hypothetical protein